MAMEIVSWRRTHGSEPFGVLISKVSYAGELQATGPKEARSRPQRSRLQRRERMEVIKCARDRYITEDVPFWA